MISAVVLTHNDEKILDKTLRSLSWCDEIIVVDDASSDGTVAVSKKFGARVCQRQVDGDFASQRNFGLSKATSDWVLFIDSDEIVSEELCSEMQQAVRKEHVAGFYLRRRDYMYGHPLLHGETGSVRLLRLARRESGKWTRPVHEVWEVKGPTGQLTHPILHYPHPDVAQFLDQINTYSSLNAQYLYTQSVRVSVWHIIGYPTAKFFRNYLWHMGFLDGTPGAILAIMMSFHSFLTRAKLYLLWRNKAVRRT